MNVKMSWVTLALLSGAGLAPQWAYADDSIKVGLLATLEGPFTVLGQDGVRGAELAFKEANYTAGGKKIEVIKGSSDACRIAPSRRRASWLSRTASRSWLGRFRATRAWPSRTTRRPSRTSHSSMARRPPK